MWNVKTRTCRPPLLLHHHCLPPPFCLPLWPGSFRAFPPQLRRLVRTRMLTDRTICRLRTPKRQWIAVLLEGNYLGTRRSGKSSTSTLESLSKPSIVGQWESRGATGHQRTVTLGMSTPVFSVTTCTQVCLTLRTWRQAGSACSTWGKVLHSSCSSKGRPPAPLQAVHSHGALSHLLPLSSPHSTSAGHAPSPAPVPHLTTDADPSPGLHTPAPSLPTAVLPLGKFCCEPTLPVSETRLPSNLFGHKSTCLSRRGCKEGKHLSVAVIAIKHQSGSHSMDTKVITADFAQPEKNYVQQTISVAFERHKIK